LHASAKYIGGTYYSSGGDYNGRTGQASILIVDDEPSLVDLVLLASFMPVISAVSGNAGLQAAAIVVRGLDRAREHEELDAPG
jgi:hypothetical protein